MKLKIAMIGGGSYSWAYGLYSTFLDNDFFDRETELCLYDINPTALDDVYNFISTIFNNMDEIKAAHAKGNELDLSFAASYGSVPYHPGAVKYFKEKGITVK